MLTFDRLKIISSMNSMTITDEDAFSKVIKDDEIMALRYEQSSPYKLRMKVDYCKCEVSIEFTGKVLGQRYPELISAESIEDCFRNIESLGFCSFNLPVIMESDIVSCDVTKDIPVEDISLLTSYMKSHVSNYKQINSRICRNGNLIIEKNVTSRDCQKRLTIYDKEKEMKLSNNRPFARGNGLEGVFDGLCRFELRLQSKEAIRNALSIPITSLNAVLSSSANPIPDFLNGTITMECGKRHFSSLKEYMYSLVLKDNDYDLEKVEATIREILPKRGTSIKKKMDIFRDYYDSMETNSGNGAELYSDVLKRLIG